MIDAIHFLVTYRCTRACPHCFVWGSPEAQGTFDDARMRSYIAASRELGLSAVCFEGGEPMLYRHLVTGWIAYAAELGLSPGLVTNGFWATDPPTARSILGELRSLGLADLMISSDDYHGGEQERRRAHFVVETARELGIPTVLAVTNREQVMFRGRAAAQLASAASPMQPPGKLISCPHETLDNPGRVHLDDQGYLHLCQGLTMGRAADPRDLGDVLRGYAAASHPIVGPLLAGGPYELARVHRLPLAPGYADACHLCYEVRRALRGDYPELLAPDHVYGHGAAI